jgi:type VI protein secretion system component VasF
MRVSTLYKPPAAPVRERVPLLRITLWAAMLIVLLAGIALYFGFERGISALL